MHLLLGSGLPFLQPSQVSGLTGWWRADADAYNIADTTLATDGQNVVQWKDQSGNSRHLVTGTAPSWEDAEVNGKPVIRFVQASSEVLSSTGFAVSTFITDSAYTIFAALKKTTVDQIDGLWYADDNIAADDAIGAQTVVGDDFVVSNYDGSADTVTKAGTLTGAFNVVTAMHSGGNIFAGISDTRTASLSSAASGNTSVLTQVLNVGRSRGAFGSFDLAEMFIYNVAVSETERMLLERYLSLKYNITLPY